jgi:hypothetical protein
VIVWLLWLYDVINNLSSTRARTALTHTRDVLRVETNLGVGVEHALNKFTARHHLLALAASDYYDVAHFGVALTVLIALWLVRPHGYRRLRRALVIVNLGGFATFWLWPMSPPRLLPGFVDLVALSHAIGSWHTGTLSTAANQYASMPSLHMSWAIWSAIGIWTCTRRVLLRAAGVLHPIITLVAVIVTGNHLLIDSAAGVTLTFIALPLAGLHPRNRTARKGRSKPFAATAETTTWSPEISPESIGATRDTSDQPS